MFECADDEQKRISLMMFVGMSEEYPLVGGVDLTRSEARDVIKLLRDAILHLRDEGALHMPEEEEMECGRGHEPHTRLGCGPPLPRESAKKEE